MSNMRFVSCCLLSCLLIFCGCELIENLIGTDDMIEFWPRNLVFELEGGTQTVSVTVYTRRWTISGETDWCTVSPSTGGEGRSEITVSVTANDSISERHTTLILLNSRGHDESLSVTQKTYYYPPDEDDDATEAWINGVLWATRNVGEPGTFVATPEEAGMYYQWNRKIGWVSRPLLSSEGDTTWDSSMPSGTTWEKINDPSPVGWRVPTADEFYTLFDTEKVRSEWCNRNGVAGVKYTDNSNGNTIFFPNSSSFIYGGYQFYRSDTYYWSSTQYDSNNAMAFQFNGLSYYDRGFGFRIRSVAD